MAAHPCGDGCLQGLVTLGGIALCLRDVIRAPLQRRGPLCGGRLALSDLPGLRLQVRLWQHGGAAVKNI